MTEPSSLSIPEQQNQLAKPAQIAPQMFQLLYSSLPGSTPAEKLKIANIVTGDQAIIWDVCPCEVDVVHCLTAMVTDVDPDTGEVVEKLKVFLIDAQGGVWVTTSAVCVAYLQRLVAIYGPFPWQGGVRVRFQKTRTRDRKECLTCRVSVPENPPQ